MSQKSINKASLVYASALFEAYKDEARSDFSEIINIMTQNDAELYKTIISPLLSTEAKKEIIKQVFNGRIKDYMYDYILVLINSRRIDLILDIYAGYLDIVNFSNGVICGEIKIPDYASKEDEKNISSVVSALLKSKVDLSFEKDKSIIAGFNGMVGGNFIDYSVLGHLKQLKNELK